MYFLRTRKLEGWVSFFPLQQLRSEKRPVASRTTLRVSKENPASQSQALLKDANFSPQTMYVGKMCPLSNCSDVMFIANLTPYCLTAKFLTA